jgi:membrane-bound lytic murein transglycosylase A
VWFQTELPRIDSAGRLVGWRPVARFALIQDTGGAIRGLQRADIYFGSREEAAGLAGYMNRPGKMFFLLLKSNPPSAHAGMTESCAEPVAKGSKGSR